MEQTKVKRRKKEKEYIPRVPFGKYVRRHWILYLMILPGCIYFLIFKYIPMGGLMIAFQDYSPFAGFLQSPFVGWKHFRNFFIGSDFFMLLRNTLAISFLNLLFYFPMPVIMALLLNEVMHLKYKNLVQTMVYVPHFICNLLLQGAGEPLMAAANDPGGFLPHVQTGKKIWENLRFSSL